MKISTHRLSITYLKNKIQVLLYEFKNPNEPWLTRTSVRILEDWLRPTDKGIEFGSGRSTHWIASRVSHLISIEHNKNWYETVSEQIKDYGSKVSYYLCEDEVSNALFSSYVDIFSSLSPNSLNFCLIDGKFRDYCSLLSIDKLVSGGILIIDNVNWYLPRDNISSAPNCRKISDGYQSEIWKTVGEKIADWRCIWTSNGVTETAIFIKP